MAHKLRAATAETLAGNRTLTATEVRTYGIWAFDPGGAARDLVVPAATSCTGEILMVTNTADADETITVKVGSTEVCQVAEGQCVLLFCTGSVWAGVTSYIIPPEAPPG